MGAEGGRAAARPGRTLSGNIAIFRNGGVVLCVGVLALSAGCGYTTRPGLPADVRTIYIQPFENRVDFARLTSDVSGFPLYRHNLEVDITNAVISRFQFTGLLRPAAAARADWRLEGALVEFRRDALRYNASQDVEEWRLNLVVDLTMIDQRTNTLLWREPRFTGDTTYFALGANAETEAAALSRAVTDLARRVVERTVENW